MAVSHFALDFNETLHLALFSPVESDIQLVASKILSPQCALINPSLILHLDQVLIAANKAVVAQRMKKLITKTLATEVIYNLSLSRNITQSLATFGPKNIDRTMIIAVIGQDGDQNIENILREIPGQLHEQEYLEHLRNINLIRSIYEIPEFVKEYDVLDLIITKMSCKLL